MCGVITKALCGLVKHNIIRDLFKVIFTELSRRVEMISGSDFIFEVVELMHYKLHKICLKRGGSYTKSSKWLLPKGATTNLKNGKDDNCFQCALTLALNYNEIKEKELENIFKKIRDEYIDFSSHQKGWKNFQQNNELTALNVLLSSQDSEEITLVYKLEHKYKRENNALLLMINDNEKYYYFALKSKLELYSSEWLKSKEEAIINGDNCFQNALDDLLDYQRIKKDRKKYQKLSHILNSITGKI